MSLSPGYRRRAADVLDVTGPDRESFLQGQCTNDVRALGPGEVLRAAVLTSKGKLAAFFRCARADDRFRLLGEGCLAAELAPHLRRSLVFTRAAVEEASDLDRIDFYGTPPAALPAAPGRRVVSGQVDGVRVDVWPGESEWSAVALVERDRAGELLAALGPDLREIADEEAETARVEAARAAWNVDVDGTRLPDEAGFEDAISRTKGCYVGQEIVARRKTYGRLHRRLVRWSFPNGVVPAGTTLVGGPGGTDELGNVTSAVHSPRLGGIGLGWASAAVEVGGRLVSRDDPALTARLESTLLA
jgi:folate-binding protein YgfZ